jgi:hypothetical protein
VDEVVTAFWTLLVSGGRVCIVVPMNEFRSTGWLPEFAPEETACHVRVFTEAGLQERFGEYPDFRIVKLSGAWRPDRYPVAVVPVEFGSYFVAFSKP